VNIGAPAFAVVMVNYRAPDLVTERATALLAEGIRCIVADNSGDLSGSSFPVVDCGGNVGFGAACNRAVEMLDADVEVVVLHNPDVEVVAADLRMLVADAARRGGAVAPAVRTDGVVRRNGFHYPSVAREAVVGRRAAAGSRAGYPTDARVTRSVTGRGRRFGTGALLAIDRVAYRAIGGFDERYFLYAEDLDLWHRLGSRGYETSFAPEIVADHAGKGGSDMAAPPRELLRWLGVELFAELHAPRGWWPYRAVHRSLLPRMRGLGSLGEQVGDLWRARARPSRVLAAVRDDFVAVSGIVR
jgi:N-acetylglucosaminyl-diphospho-decaprenol L-rhamnosyltransferase